MPWHPVILSRLGAAALLGAAASAAQGQPATPAAPAGLTLAQAVATARVHAPLLLSAGGRRAVVEGRARAEAAFPNPVLEWRRENDRTPLLPDVFVTVAVPVDVTGRRAGLLSAATAARRRAVAESLAVAREAEYAAARAWWRAALAQGVADAAAETRAALDGIAAFDSVRFAQGAVAEATVLRTRVEAARARLAEAGALAEVGRARTELSRALGVRADSLPPVAGPGVASREAAPPDTVAALAAALARPDVAAASHALEEAERRAAAERRYVLGGDVQLIGGSKRTAGVDGAVLSALVPLPAFNRNGGARERAYGELLQARAEARDAALRARAEVRAALDAVAALRAAAPDGGAGLARSGRDVASITAAAYREGASSLLELLEAQRARADAIAAGLRWRHDLALARLELDRATGQPVTETEP